MGSCYVLGGFAESSLSRDTIGLLPVWVDVPTLVLGGFGALRLAANGVDPGPPDGAQLYASRALGPYVQFPAIQLGLQLLSHGVTVRIAWYDWRKSHWTAGRTLANSIRANDTGADPCSIVGHSAGGLVARAAWSELGTTGEQGLVRRIITLGTPHQGSYEPVATFAGQSNLLRQVYDLNHQIGGWLGAAGDLVGYRRWTVADLVALTCTWPALYELMPLLDVPAAVSDPNRSAIYDASNWPSELPVSQDWLSWSRNQFGPWLRSPTSKPPPHVLTCVSGRSGSTYSRLADPNSLGQITGLAADESGDGIVTLSSAELETGAVYRVTCDHPSLLPDLVNSGELRDLVLEVREPTPTPPPPVVQTAILPAVLPGPPLEQAIAPYAPGPGCLERKCGC